MNAFGKLFPKFNLWIFHSVERNIFIAAENTFQLKDINILWQP